MWRKLLLSLWGEGCRMKCTCPPSNHHVMCSRHKRFRISKAGKAFLRSVAHLETFDAPRKYTEILVVNALNTRAFITWTHDESALTLTSTGRRIAEQLAKEYAQEQVNSALDAVNELVRADGDDLRNTTYSDADVAETLIEERPEFEGADLALLDHQAGTWRRGNQAPPA